MKRATTGKNTHGTAADDVAPLSKRQLAKLRPVMPASKGKTRITILIDDDVLAFFRDRAERDGIGYQTLINDMLRNGMMEREGHWKRLCGKSSGRNCVRRPSQRDMKKLADVHPHYVAFCKWPAM